MVSLQGHNERMNRQSAAQAGRWPQQAASRPHHATGWLRRAVGFVRSGEPRSAPTGRAIAMDLALAAIVTIASLVTIASGTRAGGTSVSAWVLLSVTAATAPLALRQLLPLTAFWLILVAAIATPGWANNTVTFIAIVLAAYSAIVHSRFRGAALVSVLTIAVAALSLASRSTIPPLPGRFTALLLLIPVVVVGNAMRGWQHRAGDSQARLLALQAEQEAATRRALELERARIASELHDVVTHNVSVMIIQAGAARQVLTDAPGEARAALLAVETSGRAAMTELRHLLGLLSPPAAAGGEAPGGTGADAGSTPADQTPADQDLRPQPGLGQLQALIDRVAAAGLPVELHVGDMPRGLPPGLDLAAFRVIQEALTNVIKHAGKPLTSVSLGCHQDHLVLEVADSGRPFPAVGPPTVAGAGRGLLGLRERTALYGGQLDAGPRPDGGWLVRARIPVGPLVIGAPGPHAPRRSTAPGPGATAAACLVPLVAERR